jgi:hypothetical protein
MDVFDLLFMPVYLGIFYIIALRIVGKHPANPLYKKYYGRGLLYKFLGALGFAFIYLFYYKGGDSINFYYTTIPLFKLFFSNPVSFFGFVLNPIAEYPPECYFNASEHGVFYLLKGSASLTTIRIAALLNIFSFNSYLVLCIVFAFISYQFQWRVFILLSSVYPDLSKQFAYAFLMIPSVLFWGSGVGKDSIMLGCIMFFFYCFYNLVILKRGIFKYLFLLLVTGYLISLIRGFILFTVAPCLVLMAVTYYRNAIGSSFLRFFVGPVFLIGGIGISILFVRSLGQAVDSYSIDSLQQKAEGFKSWHSYLGETQGGSSYKLSEDVQYTTAGILRQAPLAILITLYGPFVWQIRNIVMLLSGIESLFFLIFSLRVAFNKRIYNLFGILLRDHLIVFCAPLVIILSVAIGLTSFNYGALVRYRIPILPFFATMLIIINYHLTKPAKAL